MAKRKNKKPLRGLDEIAETGAGLVHSKMHYDYMKSLSKEERMRIQDRNDKIIVAVLIVGAGALYYAVNN